VILVRTDVSEQRISSVISVKGIGELAYSFHPDEGGETSVLTRVTRRHIPEEGILDVSEELAGRLVETDDCSQLLQVITNQTARSHIPERYVVNDGITENCALEDAPSGHSCVRFLATAFSPDDTRLCQFEAINIHSIY
jgi:hypothetical protein